MITSEVRLVNSRRKRVLWLPTERGELGELLPCKRLLRCLTWPYEKRKKGFPVSPDRVAPAEDTREWTLGPLVGGLESYSPSPDHALAELRPALLTEQLTVVPKSALTAAVLAREEAERERDEELRGKTAEARIRVQREAERDELQTEIQEKWMPMEMRAHKALQEALDLIERIRQESPYTEACEREIRGLLRQHGRLP